MRLTERYPYFFAPEHAEVEARAAAFAALPPGGGIRGRVRALGEAGLLRQPDVRAMAAVRGQLAQADPLADLAFVVQHLGAIPLRLAGGFEREVDDAMDGRAVTVFALTEPGAGSDVRAVAAEAVTHGDTYRLTGEKCFISNAPEADRAVVFARLDGSVAAFLVEAPEAVAQRVSGHSVGRIRLRDTPARLVSRRGFALAFGTLERCRPTVGAAAWGMAARAFDATRAHVARREQFGAPLAANPVVRARLGEMALDLETAALAALHACWSRDAADADARTAYASALGKVAATEAAQRVVDAAVQLHGALGVEEDHVVQRIYREIRPLRIYEGATDVLLGVMGAHWTEGT